MKEFSSMRLISWLGLNVQTKIEVFSLYHMKEIFRMNDVGDGMLDRKTYCRSFQNLVTKG